MEVPVHNIGTMLPALAQWDILEIFVKVHTCRYTLTHIYMIILCVYKVLNTFPLYFQRNCHQRSVQKINVSMEALAHSMEMAIDVVAQLDLLEILVKLKVKISHLFYAAPYQWCINGQLFLNQDTLSAGYSISLLPNIEEFHYLIIIIGAGSITQSPPMLIAIAVGIIMLLFLVILTTLVVGIYVCLKKKKRKKKMMILKKVEMDNVKEDKMREDKVKEDKMKEDSVKEENVEHIYETVRGFRNIQALYDPKHGIETMSPAAVDVSMQSNAAYDVVGMQSNMAYGVLLRELQMNVGHDATTREL